MANIMETWRKFIDVPERMEQYGRADKRTTGTGRTLSSSKKTSAERAVERLAAREGSTNVAACVQKTAEKELSAQEDVIGKGTMGKEIAAEKQTAVQGKAEVKKEDKIQKQQNVKEELKQLNEINGLLAKLISAQEAAAEEEEIQPLTAEEIKKIVEETVKAEKDTEEIKEFFTEKLHAVEEQIIMLQDARKDEMIVMSIHELKEKVERLSADTQRLGGIKIMVGVSIWCSLLTFAVLVAYVLHFI